jgi:tellurite methyltransferase
MGAKQVGTDQSDRERWDRKYSAGRGPTHFRPNLLLTDSHRLLTGGRALDVACGFGGNGLYLASLGYQVDGIDASGVALAQAQAEAARRNLRLQLVQADLGRWWVPPNRYDLIAVFNYLNRGLEPGLATGLKPGGLLFQSGRNRSFLEVRPDFDAAFLWEPGELLNLAKEHGLDILHYTDGIPDDPYAVRLIARRAGY